MLRNSWPMFAIWVVSSPAVIDDIDGAIDIGIITTLPMLDSGTVYLGPNGNETNSCECSSVFYSLVSACAACQHGDWLKWSEFTQNCSRAWVSTYLNTIPTNTMVPGYAYLNVSENNCFDLNAARQIATSDGSGSSSKAGRIAGGVIACIAGLAIAGAVLFWLHRRRRRLSADRLRNRSSRSYARLSDPPTVPQPVYQPEKRYDFDTYPPRLSEGLPGTK
ncbi:hypothetical protein AX15_004328 [Amanita polypyramis BW_CC]|nr:hypothetical protein AX15_004328 [Amanita polypyramis BW_CC]